MAGGDGPSRTARAPDVLRRVRRSCAALAARPAVWDALLNGWLRRLRTSIPSSLSDAFLRLKPSEDIRHADEPGEEDQGEDKPPDAALVHGPWTDQKHHGDKHAYLNRHGSQALARHPHEQTRYGAPVPDVTNAWVPLGGSPSAARACPCRAGRAGATPSASCQPSPVLVGAGVAVVRPVWLSCGAPSWERPRPSHPTCFPAPSSSRAGSPEAGALGEGAERPSCRRPLALLPSGSCASLFAWTGPRDGTRARDGVRSAKGTGPKGPVPGASAPALAPGGAR